MGFRGNIKNNVEKSAVLGVRDNHYIIGNGNQVVYIMRKLSRRCYLENICCFLIFLLIQKHTPEGNEDSMQTTPEVLEENHVCDQSQENCESQETNDVQDTTNQLSNTQGHLGVGEDELEDKILREQSIQSFVIERDSRNKMEKKMIKGEEYTSLDIIYNSNLTNKVEFSLCEGNKFLQRNFR